MKGLPSGYSKEDLRGIPKAYYRSIKAIDCSEKEKKVRIVLARIVHQVINYEEGVRRIMDIIKEKQKKL